MYMYHDLIDIVNSEIIANFYQCRKFDRIFAALIKLTFVFFDNVSVKIAFWMVVRK